MIKLYYFIYALALLTQLSTIILIIVKAKKLHALYPPLFLLATIFISLSTFFNLFQSLYNAPLAQGIALMAAMLILTAIVLTQMHLTKKQ